MDYSTYLTRKFPESSSSFFKKGLITHIITLSEHRKQDTMPHVRSAR